MQKGPLSVQVWTDAESGFGNPFGDAVSESHVDLGLWSEIASTMPGGMYRTGAVRVVGWTDERPSGFGDEVRTRTAVSTVAPIASGGTTLRLPSVRVDLVSWPSDGFGAPGGTYAWRFVLPADFSGGDLELQGVGAFKKVEVRTDDGWSELEAAKGGVVVPAVAVRAGVLMIRGTSDPNQFFDITQTPTLSTGTTA